MNTPARLAVYAAGLLAVFGLAAGVGAAAGPIDVGGNDHGTEHAAGSGGVDGAASAGFRLAGAAPAVPAGAAFTYSFTVEGSSGPVVDFQELHERRLHLIVVSADLVDFRHVHPEMDADGTWRTAMPALPAGVYAVYADVQPVGAEPTTLRQRLTVTRAGGDVAGPRALPAPAATATVDGFQVTLSGEPAIGSSILQFDVSRDGAPVTTDPYLGAAGHLVAVRASDLAYLHVHPLDGGSPAVRFAAELTEAGTYRLFLDFSVDGTVRTAAFTVEVPPGAHAPDGTHGEDHG